MLRVILRHTHNALLVACILLLICSLERLCRYDFAQIQVASSAQPDGLQVDNFVFWGGIPAWEHHQYKYSNNPVSALGLFKAISSWTHARSSFSAEEYLNVPETVLPAGESIADLLKGNESQTPHGSSSPVIPVKGTKQKEPEDEGVLRSSTPGKPKIGFFLHLTDCDQQEVERWRSFWAEEQRVVDQPFLFAVVLAPKVIEECISQLESNLSATQIDHWSFQVFKSKEARMAFRRCHRPETFVTGTRVGGLDELIYYDASSIVKPNADLRAHMRQFLLGPNVVPSFRCTAQELQKPNYCNSNTMNNKIVVHDCLEFHYVPSLQHEGSAVSIKDQWAFIAIKEIVVDWVQSEIEEIIQPHPGVSCNVDTNNFSCRCFPSIFWLRRGSAFPIL